jgi:hypothetical protein
MNDWVIVLPGQMYYMIRQLEQDDLDAKFGDMVTTIFNGELISGRIILFYRNNPDIAARIKIEETDGDFIIVPLKFCMKQAQP